MPSKRVSALDDVSEIAKELMTARGGACDAHLKEV